jgi:hypothetical protein
MKTTKLPLYAATACALMTSAHAATFFTDMGSATDADVTAADLDAVSTGGTWDVDFTRVDDNEIVADSGGTDFALYVDENDQGGSAQGTFATVTFETDFDLSTSTTVEFDFAYSRAGTSKAFTMIGYGPNGTTETDEVFRYNYSANTKNLVGIALPSNLGGFKQLRNNGRMRVSGWS